ncbi:hypothetical protein HHI36_002403 [Cryptolaemus montrouzieri]|uniref:Reverse transcriptase domain-containing protein n=1 Tax=Cryptolaemus montrouzieri TaxID=559131 RepID=A0ABD2PAB6_9CUCU
MSLALQVEIAAVDFTYGGIRYIAKCLYRTPDGNIDIFFSQLDRVLEKISSEDCKIFIAGDFDIYFKKVEIERDGITCLSMSIFKGRMGIAQGSDIGPLFFLVFMNDISDAVVNLDCSLVNFADDSNLLIGAESEVKLFHNQSTS